MKHAIFTRNDLGCLWDFYMEVDNEYYIDELGVIWQYEQQFGLTRIGYMTDLIKDLLYLMDEYKQEETK